MKDQQIAAMSFVICNTQFVYHAVHGADPWYQLMWVFGMAVSAGFMTRSDR